MGEAVGNPLKDIPNRELKVSDLPAPGADWSTINRFALTFNGYEQLGSFEACAEIANARKSDTLTDLRACLFFEQRRWHHFGGEPDPTSIGYIRSLVEQIRARVIGQQLD